MVEVLRKKVVQQGNSQGITISKNWLRKNGMKIGDEVDVIQSDDYILIRDCKEPFMRELLAQEIEEIYKLSFLRKKKIEEIQARFEQFQKELDEGRGSSVDELPPFYDQMQRDIAEAKAKEHMDKIRQAKARPKKKGKKSKQINHTQDDKPKAK